MPKDITTLNKSKFGWAAASTYFVCAISFVGYRLLLQLPSAFNILVGEFNKGTSYGDIASISIKPLTGIGFVILILLLSTFSFFILGYLFAYFYNKA